MRKLLVGLVIVLCATFFTACEEPTNEEIYSEIQQNFSQLQTYRCTAEIVIKENDSVSQYRAKHVYMSPNKYLIEMMEPEESKGFTYVFNSDKTMLYHPIIQQSLLIEGTAGFLSKNTFVGYFLNLSLTNKYTKLDSEVINDQEYIVISVQIPNSSNHRKSTKVWINKRSFVPYKLLVFNYEEKAVIEVYYSEFEYNCEVNEKVFTIK